MEKFLKLFPKKCSIIGMVHTDALPGAPLFSGSISKIINKACKEVETYIKLGIDGILIENMHDLPYIKGEYFNPETAIAMTRICTEIRKILPQNIPFGLQLLADGNKEALAIAKVCSLNFIRVEGYVFSHIADEGFIDANAGLLLRYRKIIQAEDVLIFADIKKKHSSHAITNDLSFIEVAKAAEFFLANGLILTGKSTGSPPNSNQLIELRRHTSLPIIIGSGINDENLKDFINADALIVGSYFKKNSKWYNELDENKIKKLINICLV